MLDILRGTVATISATFPDQYGSPSLATGPVKVTVTGVTPLSAPVTDLNATVGDGMVWSVALPPEATAQLNILYAVWTDATGRSVVTSHEVVGGFFFSVEEARLLERSLEDEQRYPAERILAKRRFVERACEDRYTRLIFRPRYGKVADYTEPPEDIKGAAALHLRYLLNRDKSSIPDRATTFTAVEGGTYELSTANEYGPGIPDVDAVYKSYRTDLPTFA